MQEKDEQAETFNQDQQEMFQHPDTNLGDTRPRTPGTETVGNTPDTSTDHNQATDNQTVKEARISESDEGGA